MFEPAGKPSPKNVAERSFSDPPGSAERVKAHRFTLPKKFAQGSSSVAPGFVGGERKRKPARQAQGEPDGREFYLAQDHATRQKATSSCSQ